MTLADALAQLDRRLSGAVPTPPAGTLLRPVAEDCLEMVRAYRADAATFAGRADPVNALASVAYATGWLDAASALGLASCGRDGCAFPAGTVPEGRAGHLEEKTGRYAVMLEGAVAAARPAPDPASPARQAAVSVLRVAACCSGLGRAWMDRDRETALALLSYGHGWIDAGVRAGLVAIVRDRSLFAV